MKPNTTLVEANCTAALPGRFVEGPCPEFSTHNGLWSLALAFDLSKVQSPKTKVPCVTIPLHMIRPFRGVHPQIHPTAYVDVSAQVIGDVHLGEQASIWCNCTIRGDIHFIRVGDRSNVQDNS